MQHYMLLVGAIHRLLKVAYHQKIWRRHHIFLKLYCAQVPGFHGMYFIVILMSWPPDMDLGHENLHGADITWYDFLFCTCT